MSQTEANNAANANGTEPNTQGKTFTQAELDTIIGERLAREKAKYANYEELKEKADKLNALEEANKSELQKAQDEAADYKSKYEKLTQENAVRGIRDKVAASTGVPSNLLTASTEDECQAQAEAILEYAGKKQVAPNINDGGDEDFNEDYCKENGIAVIDYHAEGGNIVISSGDLSLGLCFPLKEVTAQYVLEHLSGILSKYEEAVEVNNNDILVAGKKVAGSASFQDEETLGMVIHFSFSDKAELITTICNEVRKPVGFLTGITREQLREEVKSWLLRR